MVEDPNALTMLIFEAVRKAGVRVLLSRGWGGLGGDELPKRDDILLLGNCPHSWLFQRVSAVIHHGGAGTTAAGIACGKPTVIVPFFGDQPFWGDMIAAAGAGPQPIAFKELTVDNLVAAISYTAKTPIRDAASKLAKRINSETGPQTGAEIFYRHLPLREMICTLRSRRPAVWRLKRKGFDVRFSAVAAACVVEGGLLQYDDLVL